ncbi:MAG: hypothetical protein M1415_10725 [Firmicutes bacterium]|jgi:hypothetical protein|nr:hypothetical protein [Bacillota bacterium]MCL5066361.1 hypothetical protein [Bacillota bacterium]
MNDEVSRRIRQLVLDGKISAEEAKRLTDAMNEDEEKAQVPVVVTAVRSQPKASTLTIRVDEDGKQVVNVKFPLSMAQLAWPIISKYLGQATLPMNFNLDQLIDILANAEVGPIMDVQAEEYHIVLGLE